MNHHTPSPPPTPSTPAAEGWVSMRHLQRATAMAQAAGIGTADVLERVGVPPAHLGDGERMVPLQAIEALLSAVQRQHGDQLLGLHMASNIQPATLGAIGHLLQASATFGELLDVVVRYNGLLSNIGHASVAQSAGLVELRWDCLAGSPLLRRHASEYVIGTFVMLARLLAPGIEFPSAVHFTHPRPDDADRVREHFMFFGCTVHFGQAHNSVTGTSALLSVALPFGDVAIKALLERHTGQLLAQRARPPALAQDVRRLLRSLLLTGSPSKAAVATQLGMSTRSLHRRLQEVGTSYRALLDAERQAMACERLRGTGEPVADIARWLGFSSPQAFLRWFRPLVGVTPSQYRLGAVSEASA